MSLLFVGQHVCETDRCVRDADEEEALVQLHTPRRSAQDPLIVPHTRSNCCERNAGLLPQLALRRLLKGFTWLDAATRRTPIDGHVRETLVERFGIVNVEQEQPLLIIKDEQARCWTDSR